MEIPEDFVDWLLDAGWNHDYRADGAYCGWSNHNSRLYCKGCGEDHPQRRTISALARGAGYKIRFDQVQDTKATAGRKIDAGGVPA